MVFNTFIRCQVCGSITRVRLQVGWQEEHPIVVACGKCGISLSGNVKIGQEKPELTFSFDNADEVLDENADYMVECSGEFPTVKQGDAVDLVGLVITPFIRYMNCMETDDSYEQFGKAVSQLNDTSKKWKNYKRIITLFNNKSEYLVQEIQKVFSGQYFQCRDESEVLRAVHMIEVHGFYSSLKKDILDDLSFSSGIMKMDSVQLKNLIDYLNSHDGFHLDEMQELIYKLYDEFITVYQRLIPALAIQYCKEGSFNFECEGSTTSSFDSVKQFYLDVYEALGNLLIIPVALNNIKYRSDINSMNSVEKNVNSLDDFIKLTKATRYHFCLDNEVYTGVLDVVVNAKLRNAIGHNDVEYDAVKQLITYIPNPKDRTKKKTEYLLEFENEALHMFQGLLGISEYLYRLRELALMYDGKVPLIVQERANWPKKIGRNDRYPCGSGKKYKFCHGKSKKIRSRRWQLKRKQFYYDQFPKWPIRGGDDRTSYAAIYSSKVENLICSH
jgi:predicted metal-binding protein related to the C-terminal domain of secA